MDTSITITICALLLIAYLFDLSASKTKIPSVILLLLLGLIVKEITHLIHLRLPDLFPVLPVLGTIGLILIVLDGSLELELNKSKYRLVVKTFVGSLLPMLGCAFVIAWLLHYFGHGTFKNCLVNAIPFCVISSAIAIPSVRMLDASIREFVIYESSFSDILGVLFFNFISLNEHYDFVSFGNFGLELIVMIIVSFIATVALSFLLSKIEHHIKFVPIILLVILIYEVSKVFHLPALILILLFGLFIGNLDELKKVKWLRRFKPEELEPEVIRFKELIIEAAFLVRALFFLLFGYLLEKSEILNYNTIMGALVVVVIIFFFRYIQVKMSGLPIIPLLFIAPRGLITILLFLSIPAAQQIPFINRSLVIQVVIITAFIMMIGLMLTRERQQPPLQAIVTPPAIVDAPEPPAAG